MKSLAQTVAIVFFLSFQCSHVAQARIYDVSDLLWNLLCAKIINLTKGKDLVLNTSLFILRHEFFTGKLIQRFYS